MHMDMDSSVNARLRAKRVSRMDLQTSVSARKFDLRHNYPISGGDDKASGTMGAKRRGLKPWNSGHEKSATAHERVHADCVVADAVVLSGIAIGLLMMVNTEGKVGGTDLQNNIAYHVAEGGIEKMLRLGSVIQNAQSPSTSAICNVGSTANQPSMTGVTWTQYLVQPTSGCGTSAPSNPTSVPEPSTPAVSRLWAQVIPISMQVTAALPAGRK